MMMTTMMTVVLCWEVIRNAVIYHYQIADNELRINAVEMHDDDDDDYDEGLEPRMSTLLPERVDRVIRSHILSGTGYTMVNNHFAC